MLTNSVSNLTPEVINQIFVIQPKLKDQLISVINAEISRFSKIRSVLAGTANRSTTIVKRPVRKLSIKNKANKQTNSKNTLKHKDAILKVLAFAENKDGATSRTIRKLAQEKLNHKFNNSLGTTLAYMKEAKILKTKDQKDSEQYLYVPIKQ